MSFLRPPSWRCLFIFSMMAMVTMDCHHAVSALCPWLMPDAQKWSDPATWAPNPVPGLNTNVTINGKKVVYDVSIQGITYFGITLINGGELILDGTKDVVLETKYINVLAGTTFRIGAEDCPHTTKANITLVGKKDTTTNIMPFLGNKGIFVSGSLEWYASPPSPTWTNLAVTVNQNEETITVRDPITNWKVGDSIVIASTDFGQAQTERFKISSISGKTITLDRKVQYLHWGDNDENAEVGDISRNVLIQGDITSDASKFGGQVIVVLPGKARIVGVEFASMGQMGVLARYPLHWHYMGDQIGVGQFVNESSFHDNYQRCVTVHGTSGVALKNNVGYNVTGHCYFVEEGSEMWNTYDHNLGMNVNVGSLIVSDKQPSVFWITNPNNTFVNNVAVGGQFGFWFSLPARPLGMSSKNANFSWIYPQVTPLKQFNNNVAHGAEDSGIFIDLDPSLKAYRYTPIQPPHIASSAYSNTPSVPAVMVGNKAYKNRKHGIWARGAGLVIKNSLLQDNAIGVNFPGVSNLLADSTIVGETPNVGSAYKATEKGRSRPVLGFVDFPIHGFEGYDGGGAQFSRSVTFINFASNDVRRAGAVGVIRNGDFILPPTNILTQSTLINSNVWATVNSAENDGPRHVIMIDADGSLTGSYGNAITSTSPVVLEGSTCSVVAAWNGYYNCSRNMHGYSQIKVTNVDTANTDYGTSLSAVFRATFIPFGFPTRLDKITGGDPDEAIRFLYASNVVSRKGYVLQFPHPTPPQLKFLLDASSTGEWVVLALQYPPTTFTITRGYYQIPITPAPTVGEVTPLTYHYNATSQYLYLMYFEDVARVTAPTSFPEHQSGNSYVNIKAGCGNACVVTATDSTFPAAFPEPADDYRVLMRGCSSGTPSLYEGTGFFRLDKRTRVLSFIIYHNIPQATSAGIYVGGVLLQNLPVGQPPIQGAFEISWNKWNLLRNGTFSVVVFSPSYPSGLGEISGKIGCFNTACIPPATISGLDVCSAIPGSVMMYDDVMNALEGWAARGTTILDFNYIQDKRCGTKSMSAVFNANNYITLAVGLGNCYPGTCVRPQQRPYPLVGNLHSLQFSVRSLSGPLPTYLQVIAKNAVALVTGTVTLTSKYVDNYLIEDTWTRVKVPLADLGLTPTDFIGFFLIQLPTTANNFQLLFDNIMLVPNIAEPVVTPTGTLYKSAAQC